MADVFLDGIAFPLAPDADVIRTLEPGFPQVQVDSRRSRSGTIFRTERS